eukprot:COSAG01_NODE_900_length_12865_cov_90.056870_7_plen_603_part_00
MSSGEAPPPPGEENAPPRMGFMKMVSSGYEELVNSIIRPPRAEYALRDLGERQLLLRSGLAVVRTDLELDGPRGKLQCSHWEPGGSLGHLNLGAGGGGTGEQSQAGGACGASPSSPSIPCVVYMHGNCGCRVEAMELLELVLDSGMSLFSFDFGGCGWSEGEHISLGWFEREDLQAVVCHLRACGRVSTIGLWGRSMGAVTALLHGDRDPTIAGMVLDSPFSSLRSLAHELVSHFEYKVPKFAVSAALSMVKSSVKKRAGFSVDELSPIEHVDSCWIPALFAAANEDDFIGKHHSEQIHAAYAGDKNLVTFQGDHNSHRPRFFLDSAAIFLQSRLFPEGAPEPAGAAAAASTPPHQRHPGGGGGGGALATHLLFSPRAPGSPMPAPGAGAAGAAGAGAGGAMEALTLDDGGRSAAAAPFYPSTRERLGGLSLGGALGGLSEGGGGGGEGGEGGEGGDHAAEHEVRLPGRGGSSSVHAIQATEQLRASQGGRAPVTRTLPAAAAAAADCSLSVYVCVCVLCVCVCVCVWQAAVLSQLQEVFGLSRTSSRRAAAAVGYASAETAAQFYFDHLEVWRQRPFLRPSWPAVLTGIDLGEKSVLVQKY